MENQLTHKSEIIQSLKKEILALQGHRRATGDEIPLTILGPMLVAFPEKTFPTGAVHEFVSYETEDAAATTGFISAIAGQLMIKGGTALWITPRRTIFPPALKIFGIRPQRIIFVELARPKECLWAIEEALKCHSVTAVIGELGELNFAESRRLQLAVENSRVTGFIHRIKPRNENAVACVTRWKIKPLPSDRTDIPGVGVPRWNVELTKVRNGQPGSWQIEWAQGRFQSITKQTATIPQVHKLKAG